MRLISALLLVLFAISFQTAANAYSIKPKPYDATYQMTMGEQTFNQRRVSDGNGRERSELQTPKGLFININDRPNQVSYTIVPSRKTVLKRSLALNPDKEKNFVVTSEEAAKKVGAQPLGEKVIDGHPCLGFKYNHRGNTSEAWIGKDIGTLVLMKGQGPSGDVTMKLTSVKPFDGNAKWFSPPADCKVVEMPSFGHFRNAGMFKHMKRTSLRPPANTTGPQTGNPNSNPYANFLNQNGASANSGMPQSMPQNLNSFAQGGMTPEKIQQLKNFANTMKQRFGSAQQGSTY